jgi:hypothetical protein
VTIFNPLTSILALGLLPMPDIVAHKDDLLAAMGFKVGGGSITW